MGWCFGDSDLRVFGSAPEECGGGGYTRALETLALGPLARAREEERGGGECMHRILLHRVHNRDPQALQRAPEKLLAFSVGGAPGHVGLQATIWPGLTCTASDS
jgi:hypothetical protein